MASFVTSKLPHILTQVYAAGLDPDLWGDFLKSMSETFGDAPAALHFTDLESRTPPLVVGVGADEKAFQAYEQHFDSVNPYPQLALSRYSPGTSVCALDCLPAGEGEKTEFFNDWMRPNGWRLEHLGAVLFNDNNKIGVISLSPQAATAKENVQRDLKNFSLLIPHITRA